MAPLITVNIANWKIPIIFIGWELGTQLFEWETIFYSYCGQITRDYNHPFESFRFFQSWPSVTHMCRTAMTWSVLSLCNCLYFLLRTSLANGGTSAWSFVPVPFAMTKGLIQLPATRCQVARSECLLWYCRNVHKPPQLLLLAIPPIKMVMTWGMVYYCYTNSGLYKFRSLLFQRQTGDASHMIPRFGSSEKRMVSAHFLGEPMLVGKTQQFPHAWSSNQ